MAHNSDNSVSSRLGDRLHRIVIAGVCCSVLVWVLAPSVHERFKGADWHRFPLAASAVWMIVFLIAILKSWKSGWAVAAGMLAVLFLVAAILLMPLSTFA